MSRLISHFLALHLAVLALVLPFAARAQSLPEGWLIYSPKKGEYQTTRTTDVKHSGSAAGTISRLAGNDENFETLMQAVDAQPYRGKRIRFAAWLKTTDVASAQLWLRIDSASARLAMDNMTDRPVKGSTDWREYEVIMDVPENSVHLAFGVILAGKGTLYIDDASLEVYSESSKSTTTHDEKSMSGGTFSPMRRVDPAPSSLGFEK
jgi:hypothetical protein